MTPQRILNWQEWLTDARLERWNTWRVRTGKKPTDRETGARLLAELFLGTHSDREVLELIKRRIAE